MAFAFTRTFIETVSDLLKEEVESHINFLNEEFPLQEGCFEYLEDNLYDFADDETDRLIDSFTEDMLTYIHQEDTSISGNFNNIRRDYEREFPDKKFADIVKKIDEDIEDEDVFAFESWVSDDWFFDTFGTYGIRNNFSNSLESLTEEDYIEAQKREKQLERRGFCVTFDLQEKGVALETYTEAKELVERLLKENSHCANPAYRPMWKITYLDNDLNEVLILDDCGNGRKDNFVPDNDLFFNFEIPTI